MDEYNIILAIKGGAMLFRRKNLPRKSIFLTQKQAAEYLEISKSKFYLIKDHIPCIKLPYSVSRYRKEDLDKWVEENKK